MTFDERDGATDAVTVPEVCWGFPRSLAGLRVGAAGRCQSFHERKGQIYFANIDESFDVSPRKAMFRMLTWNQGLFELEPPDDRKVMEELQDSTEALLMEGMRQLDEFRELSPKLPPLQAAVSVPAPLGPRLRDLAPDHLDVIQIALGGATVQAILDQSRQTDLSTAQAMLSLLERGYLVVG